MLRKKIEGGLCRRGLRRQNAGEGGGGWCCEKNLRGGGYAGEGKEDEMWG